MAGSEDADHLSKEGRSASASSSSSFSSHPRTLQHSSSSSLHSSSSASSSSSSPSSSSSISALELPSSQPSTNLDLTPVSRSQPVPLRHPAPLRASDLDVVPSSTLTTGGGKPHHQRSRSVNLSPTIQGGPFAVPMASFSWDNTVAARKRASSPLLAAAQVASRSTPMARPASHPGQSGAEGRSLVAGSSTTGGSSSSPRTDGDFPRSPDPKRSSPSSSSDRQQQLAPSGWDQSANRSASPARAYGLPLSPRLQAFGTNRARRPSSSGSGSSRSSNASPHRPASPVPLPSSPRGSHLPIPVNPDPEHPFDSIWPSDTMASPCSSPRGRELAAHWARDGIHHRDRDVSPSAFGITAGFSGGRRSPLDRNLRASSSTLSGSPTQQRGSAGVYHRRSISSSSSQDSSQSSSSSWSPPATSNFSMQTMSAQANKSTALPRYGSALLSSSVTEGQSNLNPPASELGPSPVFKVISPSKSTSQVNAQCAHAQGTPTEEDPPDGEGDPSSGESLIAPTIQKSNDAPDGNKALPPIVRTSSPFHPRSHTPKEAGSPSSPAGPVAESPPKTRSFIGMPPRSGYDLSDDPDDVGSEDGASVSSGKDSASNADDDDDRDMEYGEADVDGQRQDDGDAEGAAFAADEEDSASSEKRRAAAAGEEDGKGEQDNDEASASHDGAVQASPAFNGRPVMPAKRPSLTRSTAVPTPPTTAATSASAPASMLRYFQDSFMNGSSMPWEGSQDPSLRPVSEASKEGMGEVAADEVEMIQREVNDVLSMDPKATGDDNGEGPLLEGTDAMGQPHADAASAAISAELEQPEQSLSTLERIFLFAKSEKTYHRVIVSRSLPVWIREVELSEAVEYVIPLLNGLATDEADVCMALTAELHHVMWYFYRNCPLAELEDNASQPSADDPQAKEMATRPRIPVGVFTPLLCALLLNQNSIVASTAQVSLVILFQMLQESEHVGGPDDNQPFLDDVLVAYANGRDGAVEYETHNFGQQARQTIIDELLEHVALGMGKTQMQQDEQLPDAPQQNTSNDNEVHEEATNDIAGQTPQEQDGAVSSSPIPFEMNTAEEGDSSWDAEMHEDSQGADVWHKGGSPFGSSSPMFSAYERTDFDEEAAVGRMASISLLGALSAEGAVSADVVSSRFLDEIIELKEDPAFYVRKEAAAALGPVSTYLSEADVEGRLLPLLDLFCEDKIWHVRQAACSSLPAIFKKVTGSLRRQKVVSHLRSFSNDVSRNVRTAALEVLGEAIYLFHGEEEGVPEELVRYFLGEPFDGPSGSEDQTIGDGKGDERSPSPGSGSFLFTDFGFSAALNGNNSQSTSHSRKESRWGSNFMAMQGGDPERPLIMAYNFPAVLLTLGGDLWPRLRGAHADLCMDASPKVRQSLGASLHEIAKLIRPEATEQDLLPILIRFLSVEADAELRTIAEDEVKASTLENAHVVLAHLPKETAIRQLSILRELWSTSFAYDWRLREALALQVPFLADHFVLEDEEGSLMAIMQTALSDPVSAVREAGVKAAPSLYKNFAEHDQTVADGVLGMLADMGESPSYRVRVGFLLAAYALVESRIQRSSFQLIVLPRLVTLGSDPVVDVRMALAKVVHLMCTLEELYASLQSRTPELLDLLRGLATDSSAIIRSMMMDLFDPEDPILSATPQALSEGRRDLILGPAEGGPHRPPRAQRNDTWEMEDTQEEGQHPGPFSMDEDGQADGMGMISYHPNGSDDYGSHVRQDEQREDDDAGMIHMTEHEIESDMEMVNIEADSSMFDDGDDDDDVPFGIHSYENLSDQHVDEEYDAGEGRGGGDGDESFDSQEEEAPHHLLSIGGGHNSSPFASTTTIGGSLGTSGAGGSGSTSLGFSMNGFGGPLHPGAYSLTSPERGRGVLGGAAPVFDAKDGSTQANPTTVNGISNNDTGSPSTSRTTPTPPFPSSSSTTSPSPSSSSSSILNPPYHPSSFSPENVALESPSAVGLSGSVKSVDPFLSFVSGALGPPPPPPRPSSSSSSSSSSPAAAGTRTTSSSSGNERR